MGQPGRLGPLGRNERLLKVVAQDRWSFGSSHSVSARMGEFRGERYMDSLPDGDVWVEETQDRRLLPDLPVVKAGKCA